MASPALDGNGGSISLSASPSFSLTTALTNDTIIVFAITEDTNTYRMVASVVASGLTFVKRAQHQEILSPDGGHNSYYFNGEEWSAPAASAFNGTVTVNLSAAADTQSAVNGFGISGGNFTTPFSNPAPSFNRKITTNQYSTLLIGGVLSSASVGVPSGWTAIWNGPDNYNSAYIAKVSPVLNLTANWSATTTSILIYDAIAPLVGGVLRTKGPMAQSLADSRTGLTAADSTAGTLYTAPVGGGEVEISGSLDCVIASMGLTTYTITWADMAGNARTLAGTLTTTSTGASYLAPAVVRLQSTSAVTTQLTGTFAGATIDVLGRVELLL